MLVDEYNEGLLTVLNGRDRRPHGVMVQVSAKCNLGCTMCGYVGKTPNVGFMTLELFQRIVDECRAYGVEQIYLETAWGEPFLHPRIFDLLAMAKGLEIVLSTNITPLNERRIKALAGVGVHHLQLSFCGYDRESYELVYVGANFDRVVENLRIVQRVFAERSPDTIVVVNGVSLHRDSAFVERSIAFVRSLGFRTDQIEIKLPNNFGGLYAGSPVEQTRGIHTYKDLRGLKPELCSVLVNNPGVYVDGRVTACGCLDNSSALIIGDIKTELLREMRYGARYELLLNRFMSGDISDVPLCADCDVPYCESRMLTYVSPKKALSEV